MASPELQQVEELMAQMLERFAANPPTDIVAALRDSMEASFRFEVTADAQVDPVSANGVPAEWITVPESTRGRRLLYVHGGGYVAGSLATHRRLCEDLAKAARCEVLSLDYRLGPEHKYPAALEDALNGLTFANANGPDGPAPADVIFVAGDSAGGGLTLAVLLAARDRGMSTPAGGICLSPWSDLVEAIEGFDPPTPENAMTKAMAEAYIGGADPADPLISPALADYSGIPPLLLQVGEPEPLVPSQERIAEAARAAGVDVTSEIWPEMPHVWHAFAPILPEGRQAIARIGEWVHERSPAA